MHACNGLLNVPVHDMAWHGMYVPTCRDLLGQVDLGNIKGAWTTATVAPHGSAMLRLSFAPKYPQQQLEL
jgi:hypothetical protein